MRKRIIYAFILVGVLAAAFLLAFLLNTRKPGVPAPTPGFTEAPAPSLAPTAEPTPAPTAVPTPAPTAAPLRSTAFELPLSGATGFASVELNLREKPDSASARLAALAPGDAFLIRGKEGGWLRVRAAGREGYLSARYCLINLPDIIPSIVYDATNTYAALLRSSGKAIPGVTGKGLYPGKRANPRLGEKAFIMPVLYPMAEKLYAAQRAARKNGETLVLYEAYRPYDVQMTIVRALQKLAEADRSVMAGLTKPPWALSWFASTGLSNHQRGGAVDVSLAKIVRTEERRAGAYGYAVTTEATLLDMPTRMHELSPAAAVFTGPVSGRSSTAWKKATLAPSMNAPAKRLQKYMTDAGLTPLASEWWHFNDLDALALSKAGKSAGKFALSQVVSEVP